MVAASAGEIVGPIVFDASAVIAWIAGEPGGAVARDLLYQNPGRLYMHGINAAEVLYHFRRKRRDGMTVAAEQMEAAGIVIVETLDRDLREDIAVLKTDHGPLSLADCCFLALARRMEALAVTTDHGEMDALVPRNICRLQFIR